MQIILFLLFFIVSCSSCETEKLTKICLSDNESCIIKENGRVIFGFVEPYTKGACQAGITSCDKDGKIICNNYVGPSNEICDQLDNDCDGVIDEGFDKDSDGYTLCSGDCDDLNYKIHPNSIEICDNIDQNCNNIIDEGLTKECWFGYDGVVFGENSQCRTGIHVCKNGRWSVCKNRVSPSDERCDGIDNDCDGEIDEIIVNHCGPLDNVGQCKKGDQICFDNETYCVGAIFASEEVCDNIDNDCDGIIDENLTKVCQTKCGTGFELCDSGNWVSCSAPIPQQEKCDGIDNDCDGELDEGCVCTHLDTKACVGNSDNPIINPVDNSTISCGFGTQVCIDGIWGQCVYIDATDEMCNNWDDDCDGVIDEIVSLCGDVKTSGIGECKLGTSTCSKGLWSECDGSVAPTDEICDQLDNDCDGEIDEGIIPRDKVDIIFAIDGSGSMCFAIDALRWGIANYVNDFVETEHKFGIVMFPGNNSTIYDVATSPPLTDIASFQSALNNVECNRGGAEPSYDVVMRLSSLLDPDGIGWRDDAFPYIILVTDERAQTWSGATETDVSINTINCGIGSCVAGDKVEIYVITPNQFRNQWDEPTYFEPWRIFDFYPTDRNRYTDLLRSIFSNVCGR